MQTFLDSATGNYHQYNDNVIVDLTTGTWSTTSGAKGTCPTTLKPYTGTWPIPPTLTQAQSTQIALLTSSANAAAYAPVAYNGNTFPADEAAHARLNRLIARLQNGWVPPTGSGIPTVTGVLVLLTETEAQALANLMATQEAEAFVKLSGLVAQVNSATPVSEVQKIVW
jgi:hypothetical protein